MVKPRRAPAGLALALALAGCAVVPKSRLDDAAKVARALRAENAQLRDQTLRLKGENEDLSGRAVDDSRRLAALERANERLESSVQGYIDEREALVEHFQQFKRLAQSSAASAPSTAMISRLRALADGHDGTSFDATTAALTVEADRLFLPGSDRLRPVAARWLDDVGALLAEPEARAWPVRVAGRSAESPIRPASTAPADPPAVDLALARAVRVRDALAPRSGRAPARIGVASHPADRAGQGRIEIELSPPGP